MTNPWIHVPCHYCHANAMERCKGPGGKRARETHSARVRLAQKLASR